LPDRPPSHKPLASRFPPNRHPSFVPPSLFPSASHHLPCLISTPVGNQQPRSAKFLIYSHSHSLKWTMRTVFTYSHFPHSSPSFSLPEKKKKTLFLISYIVLLRLLLFLYHQSRLRISAPRLHITSYGYLPLYYLFLVLSAT